MMIVSQIVGPATHFLPTRSSVLIVDDVPASLAAWRERLQTADYDLVAICSGAEALELLRAREFAVVLLDIRLPSLGGFETAKLMRSDDHLRHIPIVFLTSDDIAQNHVEEGYALGAIDFFVMPILPVVAQAKIRGIARIYDEKQLAKIEAYQLRLLVQGSDEYAIFMLDPNGHVVSWNLGAERLKGVQGG